MKINRTKLISALLSVVLLALLLMSCTDSKEQQPVVVVPSSSSAPVSAAPTEQPTALPTASTTETPSAGPTQTTDAPTVEPAVQQRVSLGSKQLPARKTMPRELYGISAQDCEAWFADAVFIGDSITIGWKNYNSKQLEKTPGFFGQTRFLCEGSFGVMHALRPITQDSLHPLYNGKQQYVWDSVAEMGAKKVFVLLGMNDVAFGVDKAAEAYGEVLDNIKNASSGVEIYVISSMYMYRGSEKPKLNNANIYELNKRLVEMCNEKGYEFVNIAGELIDEDGFVPDEYSSDKYVHQTQAAYDVWASVLRSVAARHITGREPVRFELPE